MVHVHDAVIVGAGPGGAATAHFLSSRGLDVLLLDRAAFPRDKTCGDGLTPRALRVLRQMSVLEQVEQQACRVDAYEVVAPNGHSTTAPITTEPGALVIPRLTLDDTLLQRATRSGATFEPRVTATHVESNGDKATIHAEDGRRFAGRIAVIATGAATKVLRTSGILKEQPKSMLAARAYFEGLSDPPARKFQLRFDRAPMPGYGWVFPVGTNAANIGVGYLPQRPASTTTAEYFERFINGAGVNEIIRGARQVGPLKGFPIRVDFLRAPTFGVRTLLVGEAAGLVNPLTGEGIDYALECGLIAANHVAEGLLTGIDTAWLENYDRKLRQKFERIFRFSEWIRDWYCKPPLLNVLVPLANRRPELRQLLANIVLGEREPRGHGPASMLVRLMLYLMRHPGRARADD